MRKEGVLMVETLKNLSVCSWMNLGAICWDLWLNNISENRVFFASNICLLHACNDAQDRDGHGSRTLLDPLRTRPFFKGLGLNF